MLDVQIADGDLLRGGLRGFESQIPYATALALTRTAKASQGDVVSAMKRNFDRPTPFTLNSTYTKPATKRHLVAEVGIKDWAAKGTPAARYLSPLIHGGPRGDKRSERALRIRGLLPRGRFLIPGDDAPLNRYGNVTAGQVVKALSNIRGQIDSAQNTGSARSKQRAKRSGRQYFWMNGVGVFFRQGKSLRSFLILGRQPMYERRFDFFGIAERSIAQHLPDETVKAIDQAARTARR